MPAESEGITRPAIKVRERSSGDQFRFVLDGPRQSAEVTRCARDALKRLLTERQPRYVVASGSLPAGVEEGFFADLAVLVRAQHGRLIIDTSGAALARAVEAGVYLLAPNRNEVRRLAGEDERLADSPRALARSLVARGRAAAVAVTLGADGVLLATAEGTLRVRAPEVELRSPVGAGDSFVGGLVYALAHDWSLADACRYGAAAAAVAVTVEEAEPADKAAVDELYARTTAEREDDARDV